MSNGVSDDIRLKYLLEKYLANSCSQEELDMLLANVSENANSDVLRPTLEACWEQVKGEKAAPEVDAAALYQAILQREGEFGRRRRQRLRRRRLARYRTVALFAVLAIVVTSSLLLMLRSRPLAPLKPVAAAHSRFKNDVQPGSNKAVLVLANGQSIILDSAGTGTLATQGGIKVIKLSNGQLAYQADGKNREPVYNTINIPRGGQYELILQDGTRVWLNSESSLRYPTVFTGKDRSVELSGEAYFEVTPNAVNPFKIYMLDQQPVDGKGRKEIDVLGTTFNVMAYDDEKVVRTTLIEGALRVGNEAMLRLLKPGQQAEWISGPGAGLKVTDDADLDAAVAWKNGFFSFDRSDIRTIMRQLSRWYDLKVTYKETGTDKMFWGGIQKDLPLSDVLRILEKSGVEFSIDGKNVIVNM